MNKKRWKLIPVHQHSSIVMLLCLFIMGNYVVAQQVPITNTPTEEAISKVVSVYGIEADDYLINSKKVQSVTFKAKKYPRQRVGWNVPDIFYYVGGPIFFILLIRVIAHFITFFEEERKDELKKSLREELVKESDHS
jgi:hypothetical protein